MNKQSGMTLLEVLLAMSIFTAVALTLMSSMQGQRNAIERMRNETLALWIADNQLQSQDSFGEENTSSSGKELINGEEWNWRSDIHSSKDGTLLEHTITVTLPSGQTTRLRAIKASIINPGRHKMINRQQGFTLLEVMAALAIFSMLSVLAFMIFSQVSELHQRSQKEIQKFNQLQRTITILDNDLLQLVARRNRSTDKIMVLGEEAIFTTQSRDPLAPLSEAQTLLTVHWYLRNHTLYRAVRTSVDGRKDHPAQAMLEHVESFLLESNSGESQELPLSVTLHLKTQQYGALQRRFALPEQLAREESPAQTQAGNNNHE